MNKWLFALSFGSNKTVHKMLFADLRMNFSTRKSSINRHLFIYGLILCVWKGVMRVENPGENSMKDSPFIGREPEMERLKGLLNKKSASLIVVRVRRRIGKSRLLSEFGKEMKSLFFSGNPPVRGTTAQSQRDLFADQLKRVGIPGVKSDNWGDLFWHLSQHTKEGRMLIVLDGISWLGGKDPLFLGQLKTAWDMYFSKNPS